MSWTNPRPINYLGLLEQYWISTGSAASDHLPTDNENRATAVVQAYSVNYHSRFLTTFRHVAYCPTDFMLISILCSRLRYVFVIWIIHETKVKLK